MIEHRRPLFLTAPRAVAARALRDKSHPKRTASYLCGGIQIQWIGSPVGARNDGAGVRYSSWPRTVEEAGIEPGQEGTLSADVMSYEAVRQAIGSDRSHLLIGNGFSVACDSVFQYPSLYEKTLANGLSERARALFEGLGTNNFEGVMHLLANANWVVGVYDLLPSSGTSPLLDDLQIVKKALVEAIASSHVAHTGHITDEKKAAARAFFQPYHNIFTTNYDLLAYWVVMSADGKPAYMDGFGDNPEEPESESVVYSFRLKDQRGLFYLHGGLHLFVEAGRPHKHCWSRSGRPLTELIRAGMEAGKYPLFVAEGSPTKKLEQIHGSSYLSYALDKLGRAEKHLVVFGSSLGAVDDHIRRAIAGNPKSRNVYLGVHGGDLTAAEEARLSLTRIRTERGLDSLDVRLFESESANVWKVSDRGKRR